MTTGRDVITQAYLKAGITGRGITPTAANMQDGLADLNDMLSEWRTQRFMVWNLLSTGFVSDGRDTPYSVGPGGDYPMTPRPNRIQAAFVRQLRTTGNQTGGNLVDSPLEILDAREEYDRISLKSLTAFPQAVFLDTDTQGGLGKLYVYPWPSSGMYSVFITTKNTMPIITLDTDLDMFPDGYMSAMKFNLARRLRQAHGRGFNPDPELIRLANNALDVVMQSNMQLPDMVMPVGMLSQGTGYNIISDQFGS